MSIDLDALLRRCKPEKWRRQLTPRPIGQLVATASVAGTARMALLPDTNVYIRNMSGTLPADVEVLLDNALLWHCSVCVAEITAGIAHYDPAADNWRRVRRQYGILLRSIPDTRLLVPDAEAWHLAGMISGILARTQGFQPHQRKECLNHALIYLTAARHGLQVVSANRVEFDLIQQISPGGRFLHF